MGKRLECRICLERLLDMNSANQANNKINPHAERTPSPYSLGAFLACMPAISKSSAPAYSSAAATAMVALGATAVEGEARWP